jgi:threonine/homoserine/homoserine lactone efflux protein
MSRDQLQRARRGLIERLSQPSAAAGFAALLALLVPELAPHAPMLVELGLGMIAAAAAIVAMVRREGDGNGYDRG